MSDVTAKIVDIIAPGGATLNYQGITGLIKKQAMPVTLIKKALERGCVVYEHKDDGSTVKLDLTNYKDDSTGGTTVPEDTVMPPDLEDLDEARKEAEEEARLKEAGEYWKQYYKDLVKEDEDEETDLSESSLEISGSVDVQSTDEGMSLLSRKMTTTTSTYNKKSKK